MQGQAWEPGPWWHEEERARERQRVEAVSLAPPLGGWGQHVLGQQPDMWGYRRRRVGW